MVVAGAAGAATLSIVALAMGIVETGATLGSYNLVALGPQMMAQRWAVFVTKANTAGSYFALVLPMALSIAAGNRSRRLMWGGASVVIALGLWLSGSRATILAVLVVVTAGVGWLLNRRTQVATFGWLLGVASLVALVLGAVFGYRVLESAGTSMADSLRFRWLFLDATLQALATRPLSGIGIGQFLLASEHFGSEELIALVGRSVGAPRENPHNQFLLIVAELGVIGVSLFVWLLMAQLKPLWQSARSRGPDSLATGVGLGLVACLATLLANHSLVYAEVAYAFWLILGLANATRAGTPQADVGANAQKLLGGKLLVAMSLLLIFGSVPLRAARERATVDRSRVTYGFHNWELEGDERRVRWTGRRATFFVRANVERVTIPIRALLVQPDWSFNVEVRVDGRLAERVTITDDAWREIRLELLRRQESHYPRFDLDITPTWSPIDEIPGSMDSRELGVKVGEIRLAVRP